MAISWAINAAEFFEIGLFRAGSRVPGRHSLTRKTLRPAAIGLLARPLLNFRSLTATATSVCIPRCKKSMRARKDARLDRQGIHDVRVGGLGRLQG